MSTSSQIIHFDSLKRDVFFKWRQGIQTLILYTFSTFMVWWWWYDDLWFSNSVVFKRIGRNTFLVTYTYTTVNCVLWIPWSSGYRSCSVNRWGDFNQLPHHSSSCSLFLNFILKVSSYTQGGFLVMQPHICIETNREHTHACTHTRTNFSTPCPIFCFLTHFSILFRDEGLNHRHKMSLKRPQAVHSSINPVSPTLLYFTPYQQCLSGCRP